MSVAPLQVCHTLSSCAHLEDVQNSRASLSQKSMMFILKFKWRLNLSLASYLRHFASKICQECWQVVNLEFEQKFPIPVLLKTPFFLNILVELSFLLGNYFLTYRYICRWRYIYINKMEPLIYLFFQGSNIYWMSIIQANEEMSNSLLKKYVFKNCDTEFFLYPPSKA